jgi:Tfp pilus assembly protein PilO
MRLLLHHVGSWTRNRPFIALGICLIVLLSSIQYPLWQRRQVAAREHDEIRRNGEFMLHALTTRTEIEGDLAALRPALAQIDGQLIDEHSMELNLGYFYRLERATRVRLVRLNQLVSLPPAPGSPFKAVPFSMQIAGTYRNALGFVRALETGPRILRIRSCTLERSNPEAPDVLFDLTVDVLSKL